MERALQGMAALYSHPSTWTLKLTSLPAVRHGDVAAPADDEGSNTAPYNDRGWCFTEAAVSQLVKPYTLTLDLAHYSGGEAVLAYLIRECRTGRPPPLSPSEFDEQLASKLFTWRQTVLPTVSRLYCTAFEERFAKATQLPFIDLGWGDAEVKSLCRVIDAGALRQTRTINLAGNQISDAGARLLAESLRRGTAPALEEISLLGNPVSEAATEELEAALTTGRDAGERL